MTVVSGAGYQQVVKSPVDPSFRALSGRLKFTIRRHKFKKDPLSEEGVTRTGGMGSGRGVEAFRV